MATKKKALGITAIVSIIFLIIVMIAVYCYLTYSPVFIKTELNKQGYNVEDVKFTNTGLFAHTSERVYQSSVPIHYQDEDYFNLWIVKTERYNEGMGPGFLMPPVPLTVEPYVFKELKIE
jgi:hypothetical protein